MSGFDLTDKVAIVTGGSQGLGKATALAMLNVLVGEESAGGTPVKGQTHPVRGDISDG